MSHQVKSKDGTVIAYEKAGQGRTLVIVGGVLGDRSQQAPLASLLESDFTVFNYDRRGHGESGNTEPYAVERERISTRFSIRLWDRPSYMARLVVPCWLCTLLQARLVPRLGSWHCGNRPS